MTDVEFTDVLNGEDLADGIIWTESNSPNNGILEVGETWTSTAVYTITQDDVDAGKVINTALVSAEDPKGGTVTDTSGTDIDNDEPTETTFDVEGKLTVTKTANPNTYAVIGDVITYAITVENTGNVSLSGIDVKDPLTGLVTTIMTTMAPGDVSVFTETYTITADDLIAGIVTNTATATGKDPKGEDVSDSDIETVTEDPN